MTLGPARKFVIFLQVLAFFFIPVQVRLVNAAPLSALPAGFTSEVVVANLTGPTTIAFAPDGRMFIGQKDGRVRVYQNGVLLPTDFINISSQVNNNWDRGLLGIAIHPDFPNTPYVYLLYTYDPPGVTADGGGARVARLLRVTADPANTNVAIPGSGVVILGTNSTLANIGDPNGNNGPASCQSGAVFVQDCIAADSPSHTIGTVAFGTDGTLFVSSGDGAHFNYTDVRALRSLNVDSLNGKILRINPISGAGYSDNPFYNGNPNSNRSKVYSLGLRNPFRMTINTLTNEPFIGDVGWNAWEEINTGRARNFGWPCYEGNNTSSAIQGSYAGNAGTAATCAALYAQGLGAVQAPLHAYAHAGSSASVQAGAFYRGTVYPAQYQGALFFADYNSDWIRYLAFGAGGTVTSNNFGTDVAPVGGIVQLLTGPDTNLYYVAYNGPTPNTSEVRRIRYTAGGNTPPTANASASPTSGYVPLDVDFSSLGTFDPDAQPLTYLWNFGDGNTSTLPDPTHTYNAFGTFTVTLTVTDSAGASGSDTVTITIGNLPPVATITSPADGTHYNTDDTINYAGTGVDNEDGNLSDASLQWDILLHHGGHVHFDFIPGLTGISGSFIIPDHGDDTWIELCLTVTDSGGLNDQECVDLLPNTVTLTFQTIPSGLQLEYDGVSYTAPFSVVTNVGAQRDLIAAATQGCHNFVSWSDDGAASHQIIIPATDQTYTAAYALCPITITVTPGQAKTYGDSDPASFAYTSSAPAITLTGALTREPGETVGLYAITQGTLASVNPNYAITSFAGADFTINQKTASVTPNPAGKTFGDSDPPLSGTLSGFLPADSVTATYNRIPGESVVGNPYTISTTLNPAGVLGNYNITYNTANFMINPAGGTVALGNLNRVYDGTPKSASVSTTPNGLPVNVTYDGSATPPTDAGSYAVVATVTDQNYSGAANGILVISPATVDPIITADDRPYDGTTAAAIATRSLIGVMGSDDVILAGGAANFANPNFGTWTVTATGLTLDGGDAGNYQLSSTTAATTARITQASVTLTSEIHDAGHAAVTSAAIGTAVHHRASVSGAGATPTGTIIFTVYANAYCSGPAVNVGSASLDAGGMADPGVSSTVTAAGLSFRASYSGNSNYTSQTGICDALSVPPAFTSAANATFVVGAAGSFTVTTEGVPDVSSINESGALPTGITFTDNGDGTATLSGTPAASTIGTYNLILAATNGISPDAVQNFTLTVDQAPPPKISTLDGINTNTPTSDNILSEFEVVNLNITEFTVTFDQDVLDVGGTEPNFSDSVTNPANYMLVRDNGNGFETTSCEQSVQGDDTAIGIDSVTYDNNDGSGPFIARLNVNLGLPLPNGTYRLYVCGTTSILNLFGVELAGDGATAGTDFVRNFMVNFAGGGNGGPRGNGTGASSLTASLIPITGFAPGKITALPEQPDALAYVPTNGMRLEIPSLGMNIPIVGVKQINNTWDLKWLGRNAGYLEGSAYPTWRGNTVLTAHVLEATNVPGPFANLKQLELDDFIYIHAGGLTYIYQVQQGDLVSSYDTDKVFRHEEYDWLTLVTCENFYSPAKAYLSRRVVRAVLISVIPER